MFFNKKNNFDEASDGNFENIEQIYEDFDDEEEFDDEMDEKFDRRLKFSFKSKLAELARIFGIDSLKPNEETVTKIKRYLKAAKYSVLFILAGMVLFIILTGMLNNSYFETTFYQVNSNKLANPIRIVELSDLHLAQFGEDNSELIQKIIDLKPDLIAVVGDMNNDYNKDYSVVTSLLTKLKKADIAPIYYAYGNHELTYIYSKFENAKKFDEDMKDIGINVLYNRAVEAEIAGNKISICGLVSQYKYYESYYAPQLVEQFQKKDNFKLMLVHYPEYFPLRFKNDLDVDLALCGHAHGGIVRIPGLGGLYAQNQGLFPELSEGVKQYGKCSVVVSRGLGGRKLIPRINNHPELVVVDVN